MLQEITNMKKYLILLPKIKINAQNVAGVKQSSYFWNGFTGNGL